MQSGMVGGLEIRRIPESDIDQMVFLADLVFHANSRDSDVLAESRDFLGMTEAYGAYEGNTLVGMVCALSKLFSVPGDTGVRCAAVTGVGVRPTHRRRGILTALMTRALTEWGAPVAALWASEGAIYGRYGFGAATFGQEVRIDTKRPLTFRIAPDPRPLRLVDPAEAVKLLDPIHERSRAVRAGQFARDPHWWSTRLLQDKDFNDGDLTNPRVVVLDGEPGGYAIYRTVHQNDVGRVEVQQFTADTPAVAAALWDYLASIDLTDVVNVAHAPVDDDLRFVIANPDQYRIAYEGVELWNRLVDPKATLELRSWAAETDLVLDVTDATLPVNTGTFRLRTGTNPSYERVSAAPDLALDIRDLGSAYLGGVDLARLAAVGLVTEHRPGAAAELAAAFRTPLAPMITDDF